MLSAQRRTRFSAAAPMPSVSEEKRVANGCVRGLLLERVAPRRAKTLRGEDTYAQVSVGALPCALSRADAPGIQESASVNSQSCGTPASQSRLRVRSPRVPLCPRSA